MGCINSSYSNINILDEIRGIENCKVYNNLENNDDYDNNNKNNNNNYIKNKRI
tara:strand:- start:222 stop:380 length:159 start_codon:yes stop_codon:yes gene_type:complete